MADGWGGAREGAGRPLGSKDAADADRIAKAVAEGVAAELLLRDADELGNELISTLYLGVRRARKVIEHGDDDKLAMTALGKVSNLAVAALERRERLEAKAEERHEEVTGTTGIVRDRLAHLAQLNETRSTATDLAPYGNLEVPDFTMLKHDETARFVDLEVNEFDVIDAEIVDDPEPSPRPSRDAAPVDTVEIAGAVDIPLISPETSTVTPVLVTPLPGVKRGSGVPPRHAPVPIDRDTMRGFKVRPSMWP